MTTCLTANTHDHMCAAAGCAYNLTDVIEAREFEGMMFPAQEGGTSAHIYRAWHPHARTGRAVVKVFCMPFAKQTLGEKQLPPPECSHTVNEVCAKRPCTRRCESDAGCESTRVRCACVWPLL